MTTKVKGSAIDFASTTKMVSLLDLGPVNTDITVLLQTALNTGTAILVPIGTWNMGTLLIPDNSVIIGFGSRSVLRMRDAGNGIALSVGSNCLLKDFVVDGNKLNQVGASLHGVSLMGAVRTRIFNVTTLNTKGSGFYLGGTNAECELHHVTSSGYTESGIAVVQGTNVSIMHPSVYSSDAAATGDGIRIASTANAISGVLIQSPKVKDVVGRGIVMIGSGSKNVTDVIVDNPRVIASVNHGIFMNNAERCAVNAGTVKSCTADGIRLEGDVMNSRVSGVMINSNTGYGLREIANGASPNYNNLIYNNLGLNGNNVTTKIGANSIAI